MKRAAASAAARCGETINKRAAALDEGADKICFYLALSLIYSAVVLQAHVNMKVNYDVNEWPFPGEETACGISFTHPPRGNQRRSPRSTIWTIGEHRGDLQ